VPQRSERREGGSRKCQYKKTEVVGGTQKDGRGTRKAEKKKEIGTGGNLKKKRTRFGFVSDISRPDHKAVRTGQLSGGEKKNGG